VKNGVKREFILSDEFRIAPGDAWIAAYEAMTDSWEGVHPGISPGNMPEYEKEYSGS
jgi:hypothetical protein